MSEILQEFGWKLQFQLFSSQPPHLYIFAQVALQPTDIYMSQFVMFSLLKGTRFLANILFSLSV